MTLTSNDGAGKLKVSIREGYILATQFSGAHYEFSIKGTVSTLLLLGKTPYGLAN
jgi:hypothetical protein